MTVKILIIGGDRADSTSGRHQARAVDLPRVPRRRRRGSWLCGGGSLSGVAWCRCRGCWQALPEPLRGQRGGLRAGQALLLAAAASAHPDGVRPDRGSGGQRIAGSSGAAGHADGSYSSKAGGRRRRFVEENKSRRNFQRSYEIKYFDVFSRLNYL